MTTPPKTVLAVASGGGHWEQLMLLRETLETHRTTFATTDIAVAQLHSVGDARALPDCNKDRPFRSIWCAVKAFWLLIRLRPDVVISTGAAPGLFCVLFGRLVGAKTLWIDSVANAEKLSLSGRMPSRIAHECLTQWEHLAHSPSPKYRGAVL